MKHLGSDLPYVYYHCVFCLFLAIVLHVFLRGKKNTGPNLPPGPWNLPIIGSFHHLLPGASLRTIRDLSDRYGPLMQLRICERVVLVVSSAEVAREVFKQHGTAFEHRPSSPSLDELGEGHRQGLALAPYGEHWKLLRRVLMTELLSPRRIQAYGRIRQDEAASLVSALASSPPGQVINVGNLIAKFVADSTVRAILGDRLPDRDAFLKMMKNGTEFSAVFDFRDLFPSSRLVRMLPRRRKARRKMDEVLRIFDDILLRHEEMRAAGDDQEHNMIDVLLRIRNGEGDNMQVPLTPGVIKAVIIDVFGAATEAQTISLQWAMAELVANPRVMKKAQQEIRGVLAGQERVEEEAIRDLRYLKAVIKETLRLHPPTSLIPRACRQEGQKVQGYDVPLGTIVVTNLWAISRDPKYWKDPDSFIPERFVGERAFDFNGSDSEYMPFGAGRKMCPGISFAQASMEIALASLLFHFEWELPSGVTPDQVDMTEEFGITIKRKAELLLRPIPRIPAQHV